MVVYVRVKTILGTEFTLKILQDYRKARLFLGVPSRLPSSTNNVEKKKKKLKTGKIKGYHKSGPVFRPPVAAAYSKNIYLLYS